MKRIMIFKCGRKKVWNIDNISINKDGIVAHDVASSGFGALFLATYCEPRELLMVGFDGAAKKGKRYILRHFNGYNQYRPIDDTHNKLRIHYKKFLRDKIIPYLFSRNIKNLYVCKEDPFRGINKDKANLKII
jgi:hypothetical protein